MIQINHQNYYTVLETAERMDVHRQTVRGWIRKKKLQAVKIMGRVLVAERDLEAFLSAEMRG
jgi:excisionase family DNA binding protein